MLDWWGMEDDFVEGLVISCETKCQPADEDADTNYSRLFLGFYGPREDEESANSDSDDYQWVREVGHNVQPSLS